MHTQLHIAGIADNPLIPARLINARHHAIIEAHTRSLALAGQLDRVTANQLELLHAHKGGIQPWRRIATGMEPAAAQYKAFAISHPNASELRIFWIRISQQVPGLTTFTWPRYIITDTDGVFIAEPDECF